MDAQAYILAIPSRAKELTQTQLNWAVSDWPRRPVVVMQGADVRTGTMQERWLATATNSYNLLKLAHDQGHAWVLFTEDDIEPNRWIYHNLSHWAPITRNMMQCGVLYLPNVVTHAFTPYRVLKDGLTVIDHRNDHRAHICPNEHYRIAKHMKGPSPTNVLWGSQGYVFSKSFVKALLAMWWDSPGHTGGQDSRVITICHKLRLPMVYHDPDLIQHHGCVKHNGFTDRDHRSATFNPDFKV